jgi:hypothetical protein
MRRKLSADDADDADEVARAVGIILRRDRDPAKKKLAPLMMLGGLAVGRPGLSAFICVICG